MNDDQQNTYDDSDKYEMYEDANDDIENNSNNFPSRDREPDYPVDMSNSESQYNGTQDDYDSKIHGRPLKKKKSKKGKGSKANVSMTNRSSSAKWRKVDPYLNGAPTNVPLQKKSRKVTKAEDDGNYTLPPIKKQSVSHVSKNTIPKTYKPLNPPVMQKANSMSLCDPVSQKTFQGDDELEASKKLKAAQKNEVDYEKKNLERLQKLQEKKAQELAIMEEQRRKAQEEREKLKQIVSFMHIINLNPPLHKSETSYLYYIGLQAR